MMDKNIFLLDTVESSRLYEFGGEIILVKKNKHLYITSYEIVNKDCYVINDNKIVKYIIHSPIEVNKIVLTTDPKLIKVMIQKIPNDFLEFYIKNQNINFIKVNKILNSCDGQCGICDNSCNPYYNIDLL